MPPDSRFKRGARPSPRHKLAAAVPFRAAAAAPAQFVWQAKQLSMWGNSQYGDCVTAEEAFAKSAWNGHFFAPDQVVISWAQQHGFLNGADLTDVMDAMAQSGFPLGTAVLGDGAYQAVDFSNESVLQAAIAVGPVKIGIDASALPSGAGNTQGWVAQGGRPGEFTNEDHCVSLAGYGPAVYLFDQLGVPLPASLPSTVPGYLLFTWSTLGFVDHAWIMSTCGEAWIRNPTTTGAPTPPPSPPVPPLPPVPPVPPPPLWSGCITVKNGVICCVDPCPPPPALGWQGSASISGQFTGSISE